MMNTPTSPNSIAREDHPTQEVLTNTPHASLPTVSFVEQRDREQRPLAPLQPADYDLLLGVERMQATAARQQGRRFEDVVPMRG